MRSENDALQSKVAALEGSDMPRRDELAELRRSGTSPTEDGELASEWSGSDGQVSRKWLLSKPGAAAVGTHGSRGAPGGLARSPSRRR